MPVQSGVAVGAGQMAELLDGWRDAGAGPLSRRLAHALRSRVVSGIVPSGAPLPPERSLASALGVSRSTVVAALDELRAGRYVESRQGRGTWIAVEAGSGDAVASTGRLLAGRPHLNLAASVPPDASHLPALRVDVAELMSIMPAHGYGPAGLVTLREAIAARHDALGLATSPDQVHVTNGAQHALDLALGAVTRRGDVVAIEDPTYVGIFDLFRSRGLRPLAIPHDVVSDASVELARLCRAGRARAVLLLPAVHSPTGRTRRNRDMRRLGERLDAIGLPVIEDNTVADLVFTGTRPSSLATHCERARVLSVESMSKVGWGGLRVGWLRGPLELVDHTLRERGRVDFGTSVPSQLLARQLLADYETVVDRRRKGLAARARHLAGLVGEHLPEWRGERPGGGLSTWIDTGVEAELLAAHALRYGVAVAPGSAASRSPEARSFLRLCFDRPARELDAAFERLAHAYEDVRGRRGAARRSATENGLFGTDAIC